MSKETKKDSIDVNELLQELEKLKEEMAITNEILQTAVDASKKKFKEESEYNRSSGAEKDKKGILGKMFSQT